MNARRLERLSISEDERRLESLIIPEDERRLEGSNISEDEGILESRSDNPSSNESKKSGWFGKAITRLNRNRSLASMAEHLGPYDRLII